MSNLSTVLASKLAARFGMDDQAGELMATLKATAFKGQVSDAQMQALLIVAGQYALNPWTKEIYAFPDKNNGIIPVVGVDGWSRIINNHPQFDGMEFSQDDDSCTCRIYRKDRARPVEVTEYMSECNRKVGPWATHPKRMLRHKAMIQCARLAFGYGGIYDQDEAERIREVDITPPKTAIGVAEAARPMAVGVDAGEREALINSLEELAENGEMHKLSQRWQNEFTKGQRLAVGAQEWSRIKAMAEQVAMAEQDRMANISDAELVGDEQ